MMELLFQVAFRHGYFADGCLPHCRLAPDRATGALLARYGCMADRDVSAFRWYVPPRRDRGAFLHYLHAQLAGRPLRFLLLGDVAHFLFITEVPAGWNAPMALSSAAVRRAGGRLLLQPQPAAADGAALGALATLVLYPADLLRDDGCYCADFDARQLRWRYVVINRGQTRLHDPAICDEQGIYFNGPQAADDGCGGKMLIFDSGGRGFYLKQIPEVKFNLIDRLPNVLSPDGNVVECCLIKGLPTPVASQMVRPDDGADASMVCAMHIYL
jgi:hypothetical protein